MAYQRRRYNSGGGGGGGGSSLFTRLFSGGDTAEANEPLEGTKKPGDVPYNYKGNPENVVGSKGYVTGKGKFSPDPYSDIRGILARAAGAPNKAEDLNLDVKTQQLLEQLLTPGELDKAEQMSLIQNLKGILRSDTEGTTAFRGKRLAEEGAGQKKAEAEGEEATTRKMLETETRTPRRRIAQQTAQRGVAESTRQTRAAMSGEGQEAIGGRYLAEQLAPIFNLRKAATIDVSPGEVSQFSGQGLPDTLQKILGPGFTARGTTYNEQPILGAPIGKSGIRSFLGMGRNVQQGGIYPSLNSEEISAFLGSQGQPSGQAGPMASPRSTGEQFGPFLPSQPKIDLGGVGMPSMGAGGTLSAPYNPPQPQESPEQTMLRKQREAQQAQELLRRLLQQGTPYSPNYRNF